MRWCVAHAFARARAARPRRRGLERCARTVSQHRVTASSSLPVASQQRQRRTYRVVLHLRAFLSIFFSRRRARPPAAAAVAAATPHHREEQLNTWRSKTGCLQPRRHSRLGLCVRSVRGAARTEPRKRAGGAVAFRRTAGPDRRALQLQPTVCFFCFSHHHAPVTAPLPRPFRRRRWATPSRAAVRALRRCGGAPPASRHPRPPPPRATRPRPTPPQARGPSWCASPAPRPRARCAASPPARARCGAGAPPCRRRRGRAGARGRRRPRARGSRAEARCGPRATRLRPRGASPGARQPLRRRARSAISRAVCKRAGRSHPGGRTLDVVGPEPRPDPRAVRERDALLRPRERPRLPVHLRAQVLRVRRAPGAPAALERLLLRRRRWGARGRSQRRSEFELRPRSISDTSPRRRRAGSPPQRRRGACGARAVSNMISTEWPWPSRLA